MIKKLQHRFFMLAMVCMIFIFAIILISLNLFLTYSNRKQGYEQLASYAEHQEMRQAAGPPNETDLTEDEEMAEPAPAAEDGFAAPEFADFSRDPENFPRHLDWFNDIRISTITYQEDGTSRISLSDNPNLTEEEILSFGSDILSAGKTQGHLTNYLYLVRTSDQETAVYLMDYTPESNVSARLLLICLAVGLIGILIISVPIYFLSRQVVKPVQIAFDRQKQFIADASHELKTPLTIINANAEVLAGSLTGNKWLSHILEQSDRMRLLINSLLELARLDDGRLDDGRQKQSFQSFNLSKAVESAALSFESLAFEYDKSFHINIQEGLSLDGDENSIRQLVTILLDNAFKYSDPKGEISLILRNERSHSSLAGLSGQTMAHPGSHSNAKKELLVTNTGKGIPADDQKHIFERFYRSDSSRSRESGGYGLGLSIACSIVSLHRGKITVKSESDGETTFSVLLP